MDIHNVKKFGNNILAVQSNVVFVSARTLPSSSNPSTHSYQQIVKNKREKNNFSPNIRNEIKIQINHIPPKRD